MQHLQQEEEVMTHSVHLMDYLIVVVSFIHLEVDLPSQNLVSGSPIRLIPSLEILLISIGIIRNQLELIGWMDNFNGVDIGQYRLLEQEELLEWVLYISRQLDHSWIFRMITIKGISEKTRNRCKKLWNQGSKLLFIFNCCSISWNSIVVFNL